MAAKLGGREGRREISAVAMHFRSGPAKPTVLPPLTRVLLAPPLYLLRSLRWEAEMPGS